MKLKSLLKDVKVKYTNSTKNINIEHLSISTSDISKNTLFVCINGNNYNGHNFKKEALNLGAVAFVVEEYDENFDGIQIVVNSTRDALSKIAKKFYKIRKGLKIIGITGTNGKTTTTFLLANILKASGKRVGIIGTEGVIFNDKKIVSNMTTPDPIELFKYLNLMSKNSITHVVMEVSAHAIYYKKISPIDFFAKGLTNITPDHLDFFDSMEDYSKEKMRFMLEGNCKKACNVDDEYGAHLSRINKKMYTYSKEEGADVFAYDYLRDYSSYCISIFDKQLRVNTNLLGKFNVENVLLACTIAKTIGVCDKDIKYGIETFYGVDGRMNIFRKGDKTIIIDFAHTPDAMEKLLLTIKEFAKNNLYCVFGCGGARDKEKRKVMGEIASSLCNRVIITNDNPRNEDPLEIVNQIISGIKTSNYEIILDRRNAIEKAVNMMSKNDVLAVLGKGAENYIEINGIKHPYSDKEEVLKWGFKN